MSILNIIDEKLKQLNLVPPKPVAPKPVPVPQAPIPSLGSRTSNTRDNPRAIGPNLPPPDAVGVVKDIARAFPRVLAGAANSITQSVTGVPREAYQPKGKVQEFVLGKKPIKDVYSQYEEASKAYTPESTGLPKALNKLLVFASIGGMAAGEALPVIGGSEKKAAELVFNKGFKNIVDEGIKIATEKDALKFFKEAGIADDIAAKNAAKLAATKDAKATQAVIKDVAAEQAQVTQKAAQVRLDELDGRTKAGEILSHDEMVEQNFLKQNVNKPSELMNAYRTPSKPVGTKTSSGKIVKEIDEPTKKEMEEAIDYIRLKKEADPLMEDTIVRLQEKYGVNADLSSTKIADEFQNLIEKTKTRRYITSAKASDEIAQEVKSELSGTYDVKSNEKLLGNASERVAENIDEAKNFALSGSNDEAIATGVTLVKNYSNDILNTADKAEKVRIAKEAAEIINRQAETLTEAGRTVQAASLIGKKTPEGMLRDTARTIKEFNKANPNKKVAELTGETVVDVLEQGKKIEKMAPGIEKDAATKKLADQLESLIPSPMWKKVVNVWKAGLLTGVKTSGVNIQSNFWNGVAENVKNIPATGIDMATSLVTGKRTKALNLRGLTQGSAEGVKKGWNYLKTGVSEDAAKSGLEFNKVHFDSKPGKVLEKYAEGVYRVLGSEDMPFFYGALRRSLGEQALVTLKNEGKIFKNSDEKAKWIQNFIDNPPEEALAMADLDAKVATFKNDTLLGHMAQSIQNAPGLGPVAQMTVLPFAKTPSAVATAMFNYAPTGVLSTFYKTFKNGGFNQKEFSEGLGRVATGTGALWLGSKLYKDGLISLGYPSEEKERAKWEATGKTPNSIKIGNAWYPLVQWGPIGSVLGIGGYYEKGKEETGSPAGGVATGLFGGMKGLSEQTFLTGVKNLIDVVNEPEKKTELYLGRTLGSVIPTIVSDVAQSMDEYQRKSKDFLDPLKARIPEVRETLRPKLDVWGQPLERNRGAVATALSPIRLSNTIQGELNTEVERLEMLGEDIRPTKVDAKIKNVKLDDDEHYKYQRVYGNILTKGLTTLIKNKGYQELEPEQQTKMWKEATKEIKDAVNDQILPELIKRRYDLPEEMDAKIVTEVVNELYKKNEKFANASTEKQREFILKILNR